MAKDGTTITYQYGYDGLRTSKTVNGEEYRYWYQDGQLVYEKRGDSKQFYYSYDGYGHLSCIRYYYNGTGYVYYVQTNTRGDVEALYLGDGSCEYDTSMTAGAIRCLCRTETGRRLLVRMILAT